MIGIFDSGLGGLAALKRLTERFPLADTVYLADTARLPYGAHAPDAILRYAKEALAFFLAQGAEAVLFACGTVSALALERLRPKSPVPLYGIIAPTVDAAASVCQGGALAVLGTAATVKSRAFPLALERRLACPPLISVACPLFVSLAEEGLTEKGNPIAQATAAYYLSPLKEVDLDGIVLGCTHFSLLAPFIRPLFPTVPLLDCGRLAAEALPPLPREKGRRRFFVTEGEARFSEKASYILGAPVSAERISLSDFA